MRCEYCDVEVVNYPDNGICVCCGGKLPPRPASKPQQIPVQPVYIPVQQMPYQPAVTCPKCGSTQVIRTKRGFRWGLAILGFFLLPAFGFLLGFCGSKKARMKCTACGSMWTPL